MGPNGIRQRKPAVIMTPEEAYAMIVENVGGDGYSKSRLNMMRNILGDFNDDWSNSRHNNNDIPAHAVPELASVNISKEDKSYGKQNPNPSPPQAQRHLLGR